MTMALCFNCGVTKFGAICPCPECGVSTTGNMNLDIAFSDHHMSVATVGAFGEVVRAIRRECEDHQKRFWAFLRYITVNHPAILRAEMPAEDQAAYDAILARANPPPVTVEDAGIARLMREREREQCGDGT